MSIPDPYGGATPWDDEPDPISEAETFMLQYDMGEIEGNKRNLDWAAYVIKQLLNVLEEEGLT